MRTLNKSILIFVCLTCIVSVADGSPSFTTQWNINNGYDPVTGPYTELLGVTVNFSLNSINENFHASETHSLYLDDFQVGINYLSSPSQMGDIYLGNPPDENNYVSAVFDGNADGLYEEVIGPTNTNPTLTYFWWNDRTLKGKAVFGQPIPAPGAILLSGIGVSLVGWLKRRRNL